MRIFFLIFLSLLPTYSYSYTPPNPDNLKADISRLLNRPPTSLQKETALGCIAVSIYHEARSEPPFGQVAVGSVIIQRALDRRWPDHPCDVVRQPAQFSYMTSLVDFPPIRQGSSWRNSVLYAAQSLLSGPLPELGGADHYHATYVSPAWSKTMRLQKRIGLHLFFASR